MVSFFGCFLDPFVGFLVVSQGFYCLLLKPYPKRLFDRFLLHVSETRENHNMWADWPLGTGKLAEDQSKLSWLYV